MSLNIGEIVLDRYVVEELVGVGGMGEVYRARHERLGMAVAVKTITDHQNDQLVARFEREAMLLARVRHPNIVAILDTGVCQDGTPCMVMEFLEGEPLDERLDRRGALPWPEVLEVGDALAKGLDAIHRAGIIHRDLKPANVLATKGNPEVIKLVDFGIAYPTSAESTKFTKTGLVVGTPAYMAPEQLVGAEVTVRSDIYSAGLLLYELATGSLPFGESPQAALQRLSARIPTPVAPEGNPPLPPGGVSCLLACLAVDASHRPKNAREMYALLHETGSGLVVPPTTPPEGTPVAGRPPPPPPKRPQHETVQASAAATMIAPMGQARVLVAARIPASRLANRREQQTLARLAAPGRAYNLGGAMWFAVLPAQDDQAAAREAERVGRGLQERYGNTCRIAWAPATPHFTITPASLSGAAPLSPEITRLLDALLEQD